MKRRTSIGILVIFFVSGLFLAYAAQYLFAPGIERLTAWLVFSEILGLGGLIWVEATSLLLGQPSVEILWNKETSASLEKDIEVFESSSLVGQIRQLELDVRVSQSTIKEAELLVSVRDRRRALSRRLRSGEAVSWQGVQLERIWLENVIDIRNDLPSAILRTQFNQHERKLKSGTENFVTVLFTVEGHNDAYLTTQITQILPLGYAYVLDVNLVGENLNESHHEEFYLELYDWDDIYFAYLDVILLIPHFVKNFLVRKRKLQFLSRVRAKEILSSQGSNMPSTRTTIPTNISRTQYAAAASSLLLMETRHIYKAIRATIAPSKDTVPFTSITRKK